MMTDTQHRPGLEEQYEGACNASSLALVADRVGAADLLVASAWSGAGMGGALRRLHSQWVKVAPRRPTEEAVAQHALSLPKKGGKPDLKRARTELLMAYRSAIRDTAKDLRGRPVIVERLTEWAVLRGLDPSVVGPALTYWLAPQCPVCDGQGKRKLPDAPVLGASCHHCHGAKTTAAPLGSSRVLEHIDYALKAHQAAIKRAMRHE